MSASACPACGLSGVELIARHNLAEQHALLAPADATLQQELAAIAALAATEYVMLQCLHCGLEFSSPMRTPPSEWYRLAYAALNLYPAHRWEFDEVLRHVRQGESLLEIGCGTGVFLEKCRRHGVEAAGLDFSAYAVEVCRSRGLRASRVDLANQPDLGAIERVAHIAGFHVIEHLERPAALFQYARVHAQPGSHLWLSVPSNLRAVRWFGQRDCLDEPPHHMTRWNAAALAEIGARHSWRMIELQYEPLTLRAAVWWISVCSPVYLRWKAAQRFRSRWVERSFRTLLLPYAILRRLTTLRHLSGHSMLAQFVHEGRAAQANSNGDS